MVFTRQRARAGENPESPPIIRQETNIREVITPRLTVFTQKQNKVSIEEVIQCSQDVAGDELIFLVLGLNESSTEEDIKKSNRYLARRFRPDKTQHLNSTDLMQMINKAKEELGDTLRHNDAMREKERIRMDAMREQELVRMAQNNIIFSSESLSSDDSLETSYDESYGSVRRQIQYKPVT